MFERLTFDGRHSQRSASLSALCCFFHSMSQPVHLLGIERDNCRVVLVCMFKMAKLNKFCACCELKCAEKIWMAYVCSRRRQAFLCIFFGEKLSCVHVLDSERVYMCYAKIQRFFKVLLN